MVRDRTLGESDVGLVEDQERERERDCGLQVGVGDLEGLLRLDNERTD